MRPAAALALAHVRTIGYPYSFEETLSQVVTRAFAGTVVATRHWPALVARPAVYELSFQAPRGLSGAALLAGLSGTDDTRPRRRGAVHRGAGRRARIERTERYEVLRLGIALRADVLLGLRLPTGLTDREHVAQHGGAV